MSTTAVATGAGQLINVTPEVLGEWMKQRGVAVVDVREDFEFAEEHIKGAHFMPLSKFDPAAVREQHGSSKVIFQCRSGKRSVDAALRYQQPGETVYHLAGGIEGWKQVGKPVKRPADGPRIPVMRQVQITAGSLVVLGVALGAFVHPALLGIAAFIGCGLVFAGVSGWCGMAKLLAGMPWNRASGTPH